jgi:Alpha/beta hydrolase domain
VGQKHAYRDGRSPEIDGRQRGHRRAWHRRNPRAKGFGAGALCTNQGAVVPFAGTRAERIAAGDPRPSIEERYPTPDIYVEQVRKASERLVGERLLLPADAAATIAAAKAGELARLE